MDIISYAVGQANGGTDDYSQLSNKPKINNVELSGNKTTADLSISYNDLTNKPTIPEAYTLPTASTSTLGGVKVDGSTITITDGVISSAGGSSVSADGTTILNNSGVLSTALGGYTEQTYPELDATTSTVTGFEDYGYCYRTTNISTTTTYYPVNGTYYNAVYTYTDLNGVQHSDTQKITGYYGAYKEVSDDSGKLFYEITKDSGSYKFSQMKINFNITSLDSLSIKTYEAQVTYHKIDANYINTSNCFKVVDGVLSPSQYTITNYNNADRLMSIFQSNNNSIGMYSSAIVFLGSNNTLGSSGSHWIFGNSNSTSGSNLTNSVIFGNSNTLTGTVSDNFVSGNDNTLSGSRSSKLFGQYLTTGSNYQFITGKYNINDTSSTYAEIVGNGTDNSSRANAYTLDWSGNATFAGTVTSSGSDYAEYFEWLDGNANDEDRIGYIVTLDGDKIKLANENDDILGIISGTATVLGDNAEWYWNKRWLKDDFGRIIYEDYDVTHEAIIDEETGEVKEPEWVEHIHAPKVNPDYDADQNYVNRRDRKEWDIVGMMGKLYVRDDGSCVVNGYASVSNGIAVNSEAKTNMRVLSRVSDNIIRVCLK